MADEITARAIALYDDYAHRHHDRRAFIREMTVLAGSATAANALMAAIVPNEAAAAITAADDPRLIAKTVSYPTGTDRRISGYLVSPRKRSGRIGSVMVIHENRGLTDHIRDVTRRMALEGFTAFAPDFLSASGGTPADPDAARAAIGKLLLAQTVNDGVAIIAALRKLPRSTSKVGVMGFCWGGGMVNRLTVAAGDTVVAAAPYYGPAPDPAEALKVKAAVLMNYAALDDRVNATARPWAEALRAAGVSIEAHFYDGANHAFNNDTSPERYNAAVADFAWKRSVAHFKRWLGIADGRMMAEPQ